MSKKAKKVKLMNDGDGSLTKEVALYSKWIYLQNGHKERPWGCFFLDIWCQISDVNDEKDNALHLDNSECRAWKISILISVS